MTAPVRPLPLSLLDPIIQVALAEDIGTAGDITSGFTVHQGTQASAEIAANDSWHKQLATKAKALSKKALESLKKAGSFIYVMTFDEQLWYNKLNNDVIKLNIYLTTTIGEFNLILNVLQMGYITKGLNGDKEAISDLTEKQKHISGSS